MVKNCIFVINQHKDKWHSIDGFTTAILFIASSTAGNSRCWFLRILHKFCVATTKSYTVFLDPYIVFCLNVYNTLVTITTDTPRLYQVVVKYYHTFSNNTGNHCIFALNQQKGKWHSIDDFTNDIFLSR